VREYWDKVDGIIDTLKSVNANMAEKISALENRLANLELLLDMKLDAALKKE